MKPEEALALAEMHKQSKWKLWFKPWEIQSDLLDIAACLKAEEVKNPFEPVTAIQIDSSVCDLKKQLEEKDKALNAVRSWIFTTFGATALLGPPRDLLKDKFTVSLKQQ